MTYEADTDDSDSSDEEASNLLTRMTLSNGAFAPPVSVRKRKSMKNTTKTNADENARYKYEVSDVFYKPK